VARVRAAAVDDDASDPEDTGFRFEGNDMTTHSPFARYSHNQLSRMTIALALGLSTAAVVTSLSGAAVSAAQTPAPNPCALLTIDEVQGLGSPKEHASNGVPEALPTQELFTCRYAWGTGTERYTLAVSVNSASRMFVGMSGDAIKQSLVSLVKPGTTDASITDIGEAAVFKADSPVYAGASAYLKGRLLQLHLDGLDAREKKDQLITLLKSAASRM
jgi:hypothetical protein